MSEYERRNNTNDEIEECGVKEERQYHRGSVELMSFYAARAKADTKSKEMNREETRLAIERAKTTVNTDDMVDIEILEDFYQQKRWLKQELKNIRKRQREESTRIKMESH